MLSNKIWNENIYNHEFFNFDFYILDVLAQYLNFWKSFIYISRKFNIFAGKVKLILATD